MKFSSFFIAAFFVFSFVFSVSNLSSSVALAEETFVKRKILALYDGRYYSEPSETLIHKFAEMPLNFMGLDVRYLDINKGLPEISTLSEYRGVFTWFGRFVKEPEKYLLWADKAVKSGLKFVLFSEIGVETNARNLPLINRFLSNLGIKAKNIFIKRPRGTAIFKKDKDMIGFERPVYSVFPEYNLYIPISPAVKVHLSVKTPPKYKAIEAALVTTNKSGGFVHSGFSTYYDEIANLNKWILNPFRFFQHVFGTDLFPIPDVTTLVGRRMYFSHIDGDGWHNISYIERYRKRKSIAAEVVLKEFIKPYPDLPVTVALVTGDCDASIGGDPKGCDIARKMYALPHVEVGSHTHTHPFNWAFLNNYDRKKELELIKKYQPVESDSLRTRLVKLLARFTGKMSSREQNSNYIAGSAKLPRAFLKNPYKLETEIAQSLKIAQSYAPKGKKARLLQWSGDTAPAAVHIKAVRDAGAFNLNGGDTRFDAKLPSVSYVSAISRSVGNERQIYAANSNENTYTNDWTGPFYGFLLLSETVKNTEFPRRLKPFSVYYHSYSGERDEALNAIKTHLNSARTGQYVPIPASLYPQIANGFFSLKIKQKQARQWSFHNRGKLQTVRFDTAKGLTVDWDNSHGILGTNAHAGALYIAFDPAVKIPVLTLKTQSQTINTNRMNSKLRPILTQSRWQIENLTGGRCDFSFSASGFGQGDITWHALKPGIYHATASRNKKILWQQDIKANAKGLLTLGVKADALQALLIKLSCKEKIKTTVTRTTEEALLP